MKKLTAERARERIEHMKAWQAQRGLTLREEEYLEALEISLKVLTAEPVSYYGDDCYYHTWKAAVKDGVEAPVGLVDLRSLL